MDGAINTPTNCIQIDVTDAAYELWGELYDAIICSGDEYGYGPSLERAWYQYVERRAHTYAWFDADGELNAEGRTARERFAAAFDDGAGIYGMRNAR
jgi:hypothetical protein